MPETFHVVPDDVLVPGESVVLGDDHAPECCLVPASSLQGRPPCCLKHHQLLCQHLDVEVHEDVASRDPLEEKFQDLEDVRPPGMLALVRPQTQQRSMGLKPNVIATGNERRPGDDDDVVQHCCECAASVSARELPKRTTTVGKFLPT